MNFEPLWFKSIFMGKVNKFDAKNFSDQSKDLVSFSKSSKSFSLAGGDACLFF